MLDPYEQKRLEARFTDLIISRRLRYQYVNSETGEFKWKNFGKIVFNTFASCLNIPVLFYMSFYILATYPALNLKPLDMISVVFFSAAFSILLDVFVGYIFDRLIKPIRGEVSDFGIKNILSVLGTIGLVITLAFFFRADMEPAEAPRQFRVTLLFTMFFFTLANCTSFKNAVYYTPSQEDRRVIQHLEYFLKGFIIFVFVSFPLWVKFWTKDCACGDACKSNPADAACTGCITTCDSFQGPYLEYFHNTSVVFVCLFGFANIILQCTLKPRKDEAQEDVPTTFNRRLNETFTNKFILKTFFISVLEYSMLFGFGTWAYYYITQDTAIGQNCLRKWGSSAYFCTKSFWLQMTVFLMFLISSYTFIISSLKSFVLAISLPMTVLTFISGILIVTIPNDETTTFCFIAIFMACFYASIAATKMVYSNGIYYDEYKSGCPQPYFQTSLFLLSIKLGFLIAVALHLSFLDPNGFGVGRIHVNQKGFGAYMIVASFVVFILKFLVKKYNIREFDKLHIAMERNLNLQNDDVSFFDPIKKEPIKAPVSSFHPLEKKFIRLMYNLNPKAILQIVDGKVNKVKSRAIWKIVMHAVFAIIATVLISVFGKYFNTPWAWAMSIGMIYIPIAIIAIIYYSNVWATANALDSPKYKGVDRNVLFRFAQNLEKRA